MLVRGEVVTVAPLIGAPVEALVMVPEIVPGTGVSAIFTVTVPPAGTVALAVLLSKPPGAETVTVYEPAGTLEIL